MKRRRIGSTDLECSPLGFGTWAMGHGYGELDDAAASKAMLQAIDAGMNLIDTAEVYGPYLSEELVGRTLGSRRDDIILVSKVGFVFDENGKTAGRNSTHDSVIEHAEGCLERLRTDHLDLLLIHWPDHNTPLEETMGALEELVQAGKIRYYGVSNFTVEMMAECNAHGRIAANQVGYNMIDRRMEKEVLPYCLENQIGYMAYGSLCYGLLAGAFDESTTFEESDWRSHGSAFRLPLFQPDEFAKELKAVARLKELAAGHGKSMAQLALAWVLGNPAVSVALVGVRNEHELRENVQAVEWELTDEIRSEIDSIMAEEGVPTYIDTPQAV